MAATREEWLAQRKLGIGGSDAAAILGLSPWKTNVQLWEEKTGRREDQDISDNPQVQYGVGCELHMREMFKLDFPEFKVGHAEHAIIAHPEFPYLQASLDGMITDTDGKRGVLEIKTALLNSATDRAKWSGYVPQPYFVQVLHYMLVTGADFAIIKARLRSEWDETITIQERHYRFERADHENDIAYLLEREHDFWRHVETDTKPALILPEI